MGCPDGDTECDTNEKPPRPIIPECLAALESIQPRQVVRASSIQACFMDRNTDGSLAFRFSVIAQDVF